MPTKYKVKPPPPLFHARDLVRLFMVAVIIAFGIWIMLRLGEQPAAMQSVEPEADQAPRSILVQARQIEMQVNTGRVASLLAAFTMPTFTPFSVDAAIAGAMHLEHVPLPEHVTGPVGPPRRAPTPNPQILGGAYDRQRFLLDDPITTEIAPDNISNDRKRLDADARYHLLELAQAARPEDLAADARRGVRYTALRDKPEDYRGEVIHIEGDLLWVKHFELKRQVPGLEHAYLGVITVNQPDRGYWILFTELPAGLPPENEWPRLYRHHVRFDGYFLKVLLSDNPKEKGKFIHNPVLVGKVVALPAVVDSQWDFPIWPTVGVIAGLLGIVVVAGYFYRKSERAQAARLAAIRAKARSAAQTAEGGVKESDNPFSDAPPRLGDRSTRPEDNLP